MDNEELHDIDIFDISDPRNPQPVREYDAADSFPEAWTETANGDNVFHHDMVVKQINNRWTMLSSDWDMGYLQARRQTSRERDADRRHRLHR